MNSLEKVLVELRDNLEKVSLTSEGDKFYEIVQDSLKNSKKYFEEEIKNSNLKTLYFSMPGPEGKFLDTNSYEEYTGRLYYKIEFSENSNVGVLSYISSERDKRAINRYESYLEPVCEIENYVDLKKSFRVIQIEPGEVINYGDRWTINKNKKIKISVK